jgi:hypothetical protein
MIRYEWAINEIDPADEYEDIIDVDHADTYREALLKAARVRAEGRRADIELVRDQINNGDELLNDRTWAAVDDGKLPPFFSYGDGSSAWRVPQRFHREVARETK